MTDFFKPLANSSNVNNSVLSDFGEISPISITIGLNPGEIVYSKFIAARLGLNISGKPRQALYSFVRDSEGEGLEVLIEATSDFSTKIRHIPNNAKEEAGRALEVLNRKE